ncbi:transglutaminase family protein [Paenibacillus alkalitolerans]|uniref:transglutaminase family protein n=1 Tax=Paenibacillus alkalitolerans TaxID=2799335 RepID=UPI0018F456D8|nr:transglutaminase family protein [Paenibacillus alkalitolerans]
MKLWISHATEYRYGSPVTDSVNEIRLTPCTNERQSCYHHAIMIEPNTSLFSYEDYFGNRVHCFSVNSPHQQLAIRTQMTVVTKAADVGEAKGNQLPADKAWRWLEGEETQNRFAEYLLPTSYTTLTPEVFGFVNGDGSSDGLGVYEWLKRLSGRIREEFVYDPSATDVQTKVSDMIMRKRGVCQDFAHLMITAGRSRGIPVRYVSGYHFVGDLQGGNADFEQASHAWVEAFVPGAGWVGFDPTNDESIGERYVKLGHGRDYKDIVPVKGVYRGTGEQRLSVVVDVRKLE